MGKYSRLKAGAALTLDSLGLLGSVRMMKTLLLQSFLLSNLTLFIPAAQDVADAVAPPTQVRFESVDYRNILHWTPASGAASTLFYVQWKIYGESEWFDVEGCQGIPEQQCDLSRVTAKPREWYYARVRASSNSSTRTPSTRTPSTWTPSTRTPSTWTPSQRFSPRWDTKISPPDLKLNLTKKGIVVRVKLQRLLRKMHSNLMHRVYLKPPTGDEEVFEIFCCSRKLTLTNVTHKSVYCLQAQTLVPLQAKRSHRSPAQCVTTL